VAIHFNISSKMERTLVLDAEASTAFSVWRINTNTVDVSEWLFSSKFPSILLIVNRFIVHMCIAASN
jgi:hypothetical protein